MIVKNQLNLIVLVTLLVAWQATQKKVKALEQQLENEHEERINFMREKHELETKIINLQEVASRSADEEQLIKAKKDLKRTKALLKDAQSQIEKSKTETSNKVVLRQLKNQVGHFFWVWEKAFPKPKASLLFSKLSSHN